MATTVMPQPEPTLRQRADYTHSHNRDLGRHGWLRLTPAYSVKVVEEILSRADSNAVVLDPFCGTGTTALVAASCGHTSFTTEINPFLVWYASAKLETYSKSDHMEAQRLADRAIEKVYRVGHNLADPPPIFNIDRWWGEKELRFLLGIKSSFSDFGRDEARLKAEDLVKIAFCRTLIFLSNAAFNHQSMSFKDSAAIRLPFSDRIDVFVAAFLDATTKVLAGAEKNPRTKGVVRQGDARSVGTVVNEKVDLVITSPPYPNRMSYIRELRPYMYWLGFLHDAKEASDLDWEAIGGTWGSATSRLKSWVAATDSYRSDALSAITAEIAGPQNLNGLLLAQYVSKYFYDTFTHFQSLVTTLNKGATVHYIVGNSTFYGTLLPVEKLYAEIMKSVGLQAIEIKTLRKRNSKKELIEFCVSARWQI